MDFSALLDPSKIAAAIPADFMQKVIEGAAVGAVGKVILAGATSSDGKNALDPLHLVHRDAPNNNPNNIVGPSATSSALSALSPAAQQAFFIAGGHIVAG